MKKEYIFAGFGGQGMLLIGKFLAMACMLDGKHVSWLPSYGPEMRGGTANCSVIVSDDPVASPLVDMADCVVAMNRPSLDKFESHVKPGGVLVINSSIIDRKAERDDIQVVYCDANGIAESVGNPKGANVAILGALMVMPAVFAFHLDPAAGPGLTFVTMPVIFAQLPFGGLFAVAFFACLTFAALTSSVSMLELDTAFLVDEFHVSRTTGAIISTLVIMVIGFFCALSFGPLADTKFLGKNVFDWCDFLTSNISLPIGGLIVALLAGLVVWPKFREALSVPPAPSDQWFRIFRLLLVVACPILVVIVLVTGLL